jgi:hypothetical protein
MKYQYVYRKRPSTVHMWSWHMQRKLQRMYGNNYVVVDRGHIVL